MKNIEFVYYSGPTRLCFWCKREGPEWIVIQFVGDEQPSILRQFNRDHLIPVSLGGCSHASNVTESCISCNSTKGNDIKGKWAPPSRAIRHILSCSQVKINRAQKGISEPIEDLFRPPPDKDCD